MKWKTNRDFSEYFRNNSKLCFLMTVTFILRFSPFLYPLLSTTHTKISQSIRILFYTTNCIRTKCNIKKSAQFLRKNTVIFCYHVNQMVKFTWEQFNQVKKMYTFFYLSSAVYAGENVQRNVKKKFSSRIHINIYHVMNNPGVRELKLCLSARARVCTLYMW